MMVFVSLLFAQGLVGLKSEGAAIGLHMSCLGAEPATPDFTTVHLWTLILEACQ